MVGKSAEQRNSRREVRAAWPPGAWPHSQGCHCRKRLESCQDTEVERGGATGESKERSGTFHWGKGKGERGGEISICVGIIWKEKRAMCNADVPEQHSGIKNREQRQRQNGLVYSEIIFIKYILKVYII